MYRTLPQRLLIVVVVTLIGFAALEGIYWLLPIQAPARLSQLITLLFALTAALLAVIVEAWWPTKPPGALPREQTDRLRTEARLIQLTQELEAKAQEQNSELARLNVELALETAMHQQAEEIALASEERFRSMADNIQEGLTILENGQTVYVNDRVCEIFGDCPEENLRRRIDQFAAPDELSRLHSILDEAESRGELPSSLEYWIVRKDGCRRCIHELYSNTQLHSLQRTFILTDDITERVQAFQMLEQAVQDRTRELSTVLEISTRIASTLEPEALLRLILDQIQTIIPYSGAAIFTLKEGQLWVTAHHVPNLPPIEQPLHLSLDNAGVYRQVVDDQQIMVIDDVAADPPMARAMQETTGGPAGQNFAHARSWIGIPLVVRDQVTGLLSLTHSEPGYYTPRHARLAQTITNQVAIAIENARLYEGAQALAALEERQRLARELHDSVTQLLYGICLNAAAAGRSLQSSRLDPVKEGLVEIKDHALQALQEMRLLIFELNPPMLREAGLVAALEASLDGVETRTGLLTELHVQDIERLPTDVEVELYRIAMEALNNLVRYARAKKVTVDLRRNNGSILMEICDNGVGFDLEIARSRGGLGLHSMEQRARHLGGSLDISSTPGAGTHIRVEAPVHTE